MDYNESVRSDGVIAAWKADNLAFYTHFQVLGAPCLGLSDKDFSESYGNTLGKGRLDFTYRYSPWTLRTILFSLSKTNDESLKIKSLQARKDVLTDLMKEMLRVPILGTTVFW